MSDVRVVGFLVADPDSGERLDRVLQAHFPDLSRTALQKLIDDGAATVNGKPARSGQKVRAGETIRCEITPAVPGSAPEGESIPLDIVFEDEHLLVINKPRGLVVHPAPGHRTGTLVNAILGHTGAELPSTEDVETSANRPGIVHRLDKDTSGLMVVARSEAAMRSLQAQIAVRTVERRYLALVWGNPRFESGTVDAPIGRHPTDRKRMSVHAESSPHTHRDARTDLTVLERFNGLTLLEARLHSGRTHQIRVHCAYIRLPVVGDVTYGPRPGGETRLEPSVRDAVKALEGQALHAYRLAFDHPTNGERRTFQAPPPTDFQRLLDAVGSRWECANDA